MIDARICCGQQARPHRSTASVWMPYGASKSFRAAGPTACHCPLPPLPPPPLLPAAASLPLVAPVPCSLLLPLLGAGRRWIARSERPLRVTRRRTSSRPVGRCRLAGPGAGCSAAAAAGAPLPCAPLAAPPPSAGLATPLEQLGAGWSNKSKCRITSAAAGAALPLLPLLLPLLLLSRLVTSAPRLRARIIRALPPSAKAMASPCVGL